MAGFGAKVKLSVDKSSAAKAKFNAEIKEFAKKSSEVKVTIIPVAKASDFKEAAKNIRAGIEEKLAQLPIRLKKIDCSDAVKNLRTDLQNVINSLSIKNGVTISGLVDPTGTGEMKTTVENVTESITKAKKQSAEFTGELKVLKSTISSLDKAYKSITPSDKNGLTANDISDIADRYTELQRQIAVVTQKQKDGVAVTTEETTAIRNNAFALQEEIAARKAAAEEAVRLAAKRKAESEKPEKTYFDENSKAYNDALRQTESLLMNVKKARDNWSKAEHGSTAGDYRNLSLYNIELTNLLNQLKSGEISIEDFKAKLSAVNANFKATERNIRNAGKASKSFIDRFGGLAEKFSSWLTVQQLVMHLYNGFRQLITVVVDIDTAMTELRKVTNETEAAYNSFLDGASDRAKNLGTTITDIVNATADFARLGYNLEQASILADAAVVYKNVGDGIESIDDASASIISTMKAFEIEAEKSMFIVDKFNEVGNNFAISSQGVGDALLRSASALAAGNNTLDESIALVTAANSTVQDTDRVGTTMKTMSMFLRAAKTEAEEAGESTEGMADSVSDLRDEILALTGQRVDIQLNEDTFKSTYQIMKELSEVWDDLSDISQANILEMIGGKRNSNVVMSLIENFSVAEEVLASAAGAAGSALEENEKYLESIKGHVAEFKVAFEDFGLTFLESDIVKSVVDIGTGLINILDSLADINMLLPFIVSSIVTINSIRSASNIVGYGKEVAQQAILEKITNDELAKSYRNLTAAQQTLFISSIKTAQKHGELSAKKANEILSTVGLTSANKQLQNSNYGVAASFKAVSTAIPVWGIIATAITAVIGVVTAVSTSLEKAKEKVNELNDSINDLVTDATSAANSIASTSNSVDDILPRLLELSGGVNELGDNISLTDEEYEEFWDLNNKLAKLFPEIDLGLDSNGNHMLALSYNVNTLTDSIEALIEQQRMLANQEINDNFDEILGDIIDLDDVYAQEQRRLESLRASYVGIKNQLEELYASDATEEEKIRRASEIVGTIAGLDGNAYSYIDLDKLEVAIAGVNRQLANQGALIDANWQKLSPVISSWVQTSAEYASMNDEMQTLTTKLIGNVNYSDLGLVNEEDIKDYITSTFLTPLHNAVPEVQGAMGALFDVKSAFDMGKISAGDYQALVDNSLALMKEYGLSEDLILNYRVALDYDDVETKINTLREIMVSGLSSADRMWGEADKIQHFIDSLSTDELELAYEIVAADGSMSISELEEKMKELRYDRAAMVMPLDFGDMTNELDKMASSVDKLTSSMAKLAKGTALSKSELMDLITEYPKLLEQENIFADGTVEAQRTALNSILEMKEVEYDAEIDKKIRELEATQMVLDDQLALEAEKMNLLAEMDEAYRNGELQQEADYVNILSEYSDLQGQNYVSLQDGLLKVNEEALNDKLAQEADFGEKATDNIWAPYGEVIVSSSEQGLTGASRALNNFTSSMWTKIKTFASKLGSALSNALTDMWNGEWKGVGAYFSGFGGTGAETISGGDINVKFNGKDTEIDGQSVGNWISAQRDATAMRVSQIEEIRAKTTNAINNLEALKGLNLTQIYESSDGGSGSSSVKNVEEYISVIDEYCDALRRLEEVQRKRAALEKEIEHTDNLAEKIKKSKTLISVYHEEADAERELIAAKQATIAANANALRGLGFDVVYNPADNELYIKNLSHINELTADSVGEYDSLQEATNALRKETEELIETTEKLNDENVDAAESIEDIGYQIQGTKQDIISYVEEIYEKQSDAYRKIIDLRKELIESAQDELSYEDEIAEKVKEIADLQARIDQLALDDSRSAKAERAALEQELAEKQKELATTQSEHSTDAQLNALDQMADDYEQERADEIEIMRATMSESEELWDAFYQTILGQNVTVGDSVDEHVAGAWIRAAQAVNEYSAAMSGISSGGVVVNPIPKYHTGGVVEESNVGKNETLALLEKGEVVLNDAKQQSLYKIVDFQEELAKRFGTLAASFSLPSIMPQLHQFSSGVPEAITNNMQSIVFEPHIDVSISHNGSMSDADARSYGEQIANATIDKLYSAFERRGINSARAARLKP